MNSDSVSEKAKMQQKKQSKQQKIVIVLSLDLEPSEIRFPSYVSRMNINNCYDSLIVQYC